MWHDEPEVLEFLTQVKQLCPSPARVVELGSYAMRDHDPRPLWSGVDYTGVDWRKGPGVDLQAMTHQPILLQMIEAESADLVLSVSALEHDPYWDQTLSIAVSLVKDGGLIAVTCAGPGWRPHERECAPPRWSSAAGDQVSDHYCNVGSGAIAHRLLSEAINSGRDIDLMKVTYKPRTIWPHWPRSCVIARVRRWPADFL